MLLTFLLPNSPVVKRACWARENTGSAEALSPPPPVCVRNGESGALPAGGGWAVSTKWTKVYDDKAKVKQAVAFTTSVFALLNGRWNRKPFDNNELQPIPSPFAEKQVVKARRPPVTGCATAPCFLDFGTSGAIRFALHFAATC